MTVLPNDWLIAYYLRTMEFGFNEEQRQLVELARDWAEREIAPRVAEYDKAERFPKELVQEAGALGFAGGIVPSSTAAPASTTSPTPP